MILNTFELFKNVDWFLNFGSLFLLFVDLLPSLINTKFHLLSSNKRLILCNKDFFWVYFDVAIRFF